MRGRGGLAAWTLAIAVPAAAGLFRVWWQQHNVALGYALSAAERQQARLRAELQALEGELAAQLAPARLEQLGARLGMHAPRPHQRVGAGQPAQLARVAAMGPRPAPP